MLTVSIFIIVAFLIIRLIIGVVQRILESRARGKAFRRLVNQGRIDAGIYDKAKWSESTTTGKGPVRARLSRDQQRAIARARLEMRNDFVDDNRPGLYQYIIIFLIASVLGLVIETVYIYITFGILESRVGLVWGPFSPLYGVGAVVLTMVLWPLRKEPVWKIFLISAILGSCLEQLAGWSMETFAHAQSWTYLGLPDHITQWVAWRFVAMWGVLGVVWTRAIMPEMLYRIGEPASRRQVVVVTLLAAFIVLDVVMTVACFWRAGQRFEGVPPRNAFESYVDMHFDDQFIAKTFENMRIGEDIPISNK